jgi:hypothetical protein
MCSGNTKPLALLAPHIDDPKCLTSRDHLGHEVGTRIAIAFSQVRNLTMQKPVSNDVRLRDDETDERKGNPNGEDHLGHAVT